MAGMFYSLQEVCEKLGKSEDEVKQLVQDGKLREFRDGSNLLFKVEDVEAMDESGDDETSVALSIDDSGELSLAPELGESGQLGEVELEDLTAEGTTEFDASVGLGGDTVSEPGEGEVNLEELTGEELELDAEDESGAGLENMTGDDTAFETSGDSINVLGGTEDGYDLTDDTSGETKLADTDEGSLDDASLGRLDDDVSLDSFGGSGSGLLDLSLQADDTSLGAVLDDIYPEGGEGGDEVAEADGIGVVEDAEKIFEDSEPAEAVSEARSVMAYAAPVSAKVDITFGISLFVALLAMLYTGIIVSAAVVKQISPSMLGPVQGIIWYIMAGAGALVLVLAGLGAVMGTKPAKKSKKIAAEVYQQSQKVN